MMGKEEKCRRLKSINTPNPCFGLFSAPGKALHHRLHRGEILGFPTAPKHPHPQQGGTVRAGPHPMLPPGEGVSMVSGFNTCREVPSPGLGTGIVLQWGWHHDVWSPMPFTAGVAAGGPHCCLTLLPYRGGFVLQEIVLGKGQSPPEGFCKGQTSRGCPEAPVPWPCVAWWS